MNARILVCLQEEENTKKYTKRKVDLFHKTVAVSVMTHVLGEQIAENWNSSGKIVTLWENIKQMMKMLCAGRVPVEPVLTTAAACGTAVESSLGSARLPQWSQTEAYASNVY